MGGQTAAPAQPPQRAADLADAEIRHVDVQKRLGATGDCAEAGANASREGRGVQGRHGSLHGFVWLSQKSPFVAWKAADTALWVANLLTPLAFDKRNLCEDR